MPSSKKPSVNNRRVKLTSPTAPRISGEFLFFWSAEWCEMGGSNWLDYVSFQDWLPYFDDPNAGHSRPHDMQGSMFG